jgi:hypothetical protein
MEVVGEKAQQYVIARTEGPRQSSPQYTKTSLRLRLLRVARNDRLWPIYWCRVPSSSDCQWIPVFAAP